MSNIMGVLLNGIAQLEYDRDKLLPDHQASYLDRMDARMDEGIYLEDRVVRNPDINQRTQFAAANLAHAINNNDESTAAALCSYLAIRLPELKQVKIEDGPEGLSIELVFDEPYRRQVAVDLSPLH